MPEIVDVIGNYGKNPYFPLHVEQAGARVQGFM